MNWSKLFRIDIPLELKKTGKNLLILSITGKKAIIEYAYEDELFEPLAQLRLALDYSPLLATFYFQRNMSPEEEKYAVMFSQLTSPLIKAWSFKNALLYVPKEIVIKEYREIAEEVLLFDLSVSAEEFPEKGRFTIATYLIGKALGEPARLKLIGDKDGEWERYIRAMEEFLEEKPSPYILAKLPSSP